MICRPKSTLVEAHQWDGSLATEIRLQRWLGDAFVCVQGDEILIENRDGRVVARLGEWIAHLDGGFYPVEPIILAALYDEAAS